MSSTAWSPPPESSPQGRLLAALPQPALTRLARTYELELAPRPGRDELRRRLLALPQLDAQEVVLHVLRSDDLLHVARALGLSTGGTQRQLARRLARALRWRTFEAAREFVRALGLENVRAWRCWHRANRPGDIPFTPELAYKDQGWEGYGDFLGTGRPGTRDRSFRPFSPARAFARSLGLTSSSEWHAWCQGERPDLPPRPPDIPVIPHRTYAGEWRGVGDWLGTGRVQTQARRYRPFRKARSFVRGLGLGSQNEYFAWWRDHGGESLDLPCRPQSTYREQWKGWGDFLGTGIIAPTLRQFRPFRQARAFARRLGLASAQEWSLWAKGDLPGKPARPQDIPTNPQRVYRDRGWAGFGDWLGTGTVAPQLRTYWSFARARRFARSLGLRGEHQWRAWCTGKLPGKPPRPPELPTNPWRSYADQWSGWNDWLGYAPDRRR